MLVVSNLAKQFAGAESPLLSDVSFTVNAAERVGLVGANGSGKSTLLKMIMGLIPYDAGSIAFSPKELRVGYLAQGVTADETQTIGAVMFPANLASLEQEIEELAQQFEILQGQALDEHMQRYADVLERYELALQMMEEGRVNHLLNELGLSDIDLETPISELSGGQKTRLTLASLLKNDPQLLILDEPTNHLDIEALQWLENWLMRFEGGVLLVSHDRAFLDRVVNRVVAIDEKTQTTRVFAGSYTDYAETLAYERDKQWTQWRDQQDTIARMRHDVSRTMSKAIKREQATVNDFQRGRAKVVAQKAKAKETRLRKYMESDERVEKPDQSWQMKIDFDHLPRAYGEMLILSDLSIGYSSDEAIIQDITTTLLGGERIAVMGANGSGKSTLFRTIAGQIEPLSGEMRLSSQVRVGYLSQEQDTLEGTSTPLETIQAVSSMTETEARSFLHFFLFAGDDALRSVDALSYGERVRLMLARLVAKGANLLLLDEPLNHLDVISREQFEQALHYYQGSILITAHDRYFVERFAEKIWYIEAGQMCVKYPQKQLIES